MLRMPAPLQTLAALSWGATITAEADDADTRVWLPLLVAAGVLSLCTLMQATVTRRIDRMYQAMFRAAIPPEIPGPGAHGRHRLAAVPERERPQHERAVLPR